MPSDKFCRLSVETEDAQRPLLTAQLSSHAVGCLLFAGAHPVLVERYARVCYTKVEDGINCWIDASLYPSQHPSGSSISDSGSLIQIARTNNKSLLLHLPTQHHLHNMLFSITTSHFTLTLAATVIARSVPALAAPLVPRSNSDTLYSVDPAAGCAQKLDGFPEDLVGGLAPLTSLKKAPDGSCQAIPSNPAGFWSEPTFLPDF